MKTVFIILGTISLILGLVGVFIPGLPTTPFLLLTSWFYLKGSKKLYNWFLNNKFIKNYLENFILNGKFTKKSKIKSLILMNLMISISTIFFLNNLYLITITLILGFLGNLYIIFFL